MDNVGRLDRLVGIALLLLLATGCLAVLRPFLSALLWALILSFSTWPIYARAERMLKGRRGAAAALMTLLVAAFLLLPLVVLGSSLADEVVQVTGWVRVILNEGAPLPPRWISEIPLLGGSAYQYWQRLAAKGSSSIGHLGRYLLPTAEWMLGRAATLGHGTLQMALSLFIAFFFYRDGANGTKGLKIAARRIGGDRALQLLDIAKATIKGVVYGIIGTAIAQAILTAFGLWLAGVPGAFLLGFLTFFLSLIPFGPALAWLPASLWLFHIDAAGRAVFLILWGSLIVGGVDNVIKPYFISRGSDLPLILVFLGAFGGAASFGLLGVFLGPTLLAIGYNVLRDWTFPAA